MVHYSEAEMSDEKVELRPCPFCGRSLERVHYVGDVIDWAVHQDNGDCILGGFEFDGMSIAAWNTRAGEG